MDVEKFTDRALGFIQPPQLLVTRDGNRRFTSLHLLKVVLDDEEGLASIAETLARRTGDSFVIPLQDRDHSQECRSRLAGGKGMGPGLWRPPFEAGDPALCTDPLAEMVLAGDVRDRAHLHRRGRPHLQWQLTGIRR